MSDVMHGTERRADRPDSQFVDEIRIVTVPRWKESELSGDEWRIARGHRELPRAQAKRMSRARWDAAEPGVVDRWQSPAMRAEFERWERHWRDPQHTAESAFAALPQALQKEFGSLTTMRRIFDRRTTGKSGRRPKRRGKK